MPVLQLEHAITDFDVWKQAFDSRQGWREASGVRRHRIFRPVDDPRYIVVDLEFDTTPEAESFEAALQDLWRSREATPALSGAPRTRFVETVASVEYAAAR